jgi:hypothetical protein
MSTPSGAHALDRRSERSNARLRIAALAGSALLLTGAVTVGVMIIGQRSAPESDALSHVSPAAETPRGSDRTRPDVTWVEVGGVALPVSRMHGPRIVEHGRAAGYSRSELGAAFAAVQVLIRTSASASPRVFEPILAEQVTGDDVAAMRLLVAEQYEQLRTEYHVPEGEPIPTADARVLGFRISTYDADARRAWVDVILSSAELGSSSRVVAFDVALRWAGGDWRVIAPPDGDWSARATLLGSPPAGMIPYGAARGRGE